MQQDKMWLIGLVLLVGLCFYTAYPSDSKPFFGEGEFMYGSKLNLGLDLQGGSELRVALDRSFLEKGQSVEKATERAKEVLELRINHHGLKEPRLERFGEDQIIIQLPGIDASEAKRVKEIVTKSGKLEFKIEADDDVQRRADFQTRKCPKGYRWYSPFDDEGGAGRGSPVLVHDEVKVSGEGVSDSSYSLDPDSPGSYEVHLNFKPDGRRKFGEVTTANVGRRLAIILDGKLISAPNVREPITGGICQITGSFKVREAADLSTVLRSGSLPAPLTVLAESFVGPTLGEDAIHKGLQAGLLATIAVVIFMLLFYRALGVVANIALLINVIMMFGALAFAGATLTLPGIAGLVLTLGMAVDSNIIIYERIRDETDKGKGPLQAFEAGFDRAFWTVFDSNLTTFIIGPILYAFGTGPVKGFAVTLMIGIVTTMITALYCTKLILHALLHTDIPALKITEFKIARAVGQTKFPFMANARTAVYCSLAVIGVTMGVFVLRGGDNFGIDFKGGTIVNAAFNESQSIEDVRKQIATITVTDEHGTRPKYPDAEVQSISSTISSTAAASLASGSREFSIRTGADDATVLKNDLATLFGAKLPSSPIESVGRLELAGHPYNGGERLKVSLVEPMAFADFDKKIKEAFEKAGLQKPIARLLDAKTPAGEETKEPQSAFEVLLHPQMGERFKEIKALMQTNFKLSVDAFSRVENIGPVVAKNLVGNAIKALIFSWIGIILYLAIRFDLMFGIGAVIALIHDVIIAMGITSVTAWLLPSSMGISLDMGLTALAAYLTIVGYSVNDTIVIYDRIRETMHATKKLAVADVVDSSINETLSRTLMTSATVFLTVLILFIVNAKAAGGIAQFAYPMLIGVITGTYSSIFIASPLVVWVGGRAATTVPGKQASSTSPA